VRSVTPNCGAENDAEFVYCQDCAERLSENRSHRRVEANRKSRWREFNHTFTIPA
jgi:hypothetical protein